MEQKYFELWKQKNISNFGIFRFGSNYVLYEYMYGTLRHTHRSCLQRAAGDFYVYVYIQIRAVGRTIKERNLYIYFELWKQKNVSNFGNKRISSNVVNKRIVRTMDLRNDYGKTPVCTNRTELKAES